MNNILHRGTELTEDQIQQNYDYFLEFIDISFTGERAERLKNMYSESNLGLSLATAPASSKKNYHSAHSGGYIQHVMNVVHASIGVQKLYTLLRGTIDFTDEERIFSALHHDLGKLGDETGPYYVPNDSEWHIKNRGEVYKFNPKNQFWRVADRSLYNLQKYGVTTTWKEALAIRLADGLYDESSEFYLKNYDPDKTLKTNLPRIIHTADYLACNAEHDVYKKFVSSD
jgi:hypothetical protein